MTSLIGDALCRHLSGRPVSHLQLFKPGPRECCRCRCANSRAHQCLAVPCEHCRHYGAVGTSCCELAFSGPGGGAVDGGGLLPASGPGSGGGGGGGADLGLRLVASAVTAVLSLALLLFLVYRLRQRRHRAPASYRGDEAYNNNMSLMDYLRGSGYLSASRGGGGGGNGGSRDFFYQEPPPPYTVWKPTPAASASGGGSHCVAVDVAPNEAPPPYSEAVVAPALRYHPAAVRHCVVPDHAAAAALAAVVVTTAAAVERRRNADEHQNPQPQQRQQTPPSPAPCAATVAARLSCYAQCNRHLSGTSVVTVGTVERHCSGGDSASSDSDSEHASQRATTGHMTDDSDERRTSTHGDGDGDVAAAEAVTEMPHASTTSAPASPHSQYEQQQTTAASESQV